jgi:hypothetical protein
MKRIRLNWTFADIIDLEYFCTRDEQLREQQGENALRQQDRTIYFARRQEFDAISDSRSLVRRWLAARRMQQHSTPESGPLPGAIWREASLFTRCLALVLGLLCGGTAAVSLLSYSGETAVNVSGYFAILIGLQILLLGILLGMALLRSCARGLLGFPLLSRLAAGIMKKLLPVLLRRSGAETRLNVQAALGRVKQNKMEYGRLYFWPAFVLLQLFGCGFNIGALMLTLFKIGLADIAFGWQSTLQLDPLYLAEMIRWLASPWSWFIPTEVAYPSLEQIEGSRIILKEGIYHLATSDLIAWWPFLTLSVFTYGLLPRLLLFLFGLIQTRRSLRALRFDSARFRLLQQRMLNPIVETGANSKMTGPNKELNRATPEPSTASLANTGAKLLLIPDELWDRLDEQQLTSELKNHEGSGPYHKLRVGALEQTEEELYTDIASALHETPSTGIILLQEAWQPPIREITNLLRRIRHDLPRRYPLSVVLIGKPAANTLLTSANSRDLLIWRKNLQSLADPYLALYPLMESR